MAKKQIELATPLWRRPEFWLGISTVAVVLLIGARSNFWRNNNTLVEPAAETTKQEEQATEQAMQPAEGTKAMTEEQNANVELSGVIKRLADTDGKISYVVSDNDTFWSIAENICGEGKYAEAIKAENGYGRYKALRAGDTLEVSCE